MIKGKRKTNRVCNGLTRVPSRSLWPPAWLAEPTKAAAAEAAAAEAAPEPPEPLPIGVPAEPSPEAAVCRCGSTRWRNVVLRHAPHNSTTTRRDCASCRRFIGFPVWYGEAVG